MTVHRKAAGRYHHGDLAAVLKVAALELVAEHGPTGFTLSEASRRAGVSVAAPYRHFADREALLVAVAVDAYEELAMRFAGARGRAPVDRLAAMAGLYVSFATEERAKFQVLTMAGLDKELHPELAAAADRLFEVCLEPARAVVDGTKAAKRLVTAAIAIAHGYSFLAEQARTDTLGAQRTEMKRLAEHSVRVIALAAS